MVTEVVSCVFPPGTYPGLTLTLPDKGHEFLLRGPGRSGDAIRVGDLSVIAVGISSEKFRVAAEAVELTVKLSPQQALTVFTPRLFHSELSFLYSLSFSFVCFLLSVAL